MRPFYHLLRFPNTIFVFHSLSANVDLLCSFVTLPLRRRSTCTGSSTDFFQSSNVMLEIFKPEPSRVILLGGESS